MGTCTSVIKNCSFRSRSNSRNNNNNNSNNTHNQKEDNYPPTAQTTIATTSENPQQQQQQTTHKNLQQPVYKGNRKRPMGVVPCGKRTEFGYLKDFNNHYTIGKLLGHGQFGYTFAATVKANGDRVAVKRIDKNKVFWELGLGVFLQMGEVGWWKRRVLRGIFWWPFS